VPVSGKNESTIDESAHWTAFDHRRPLKSDDIWVCKCEWDKQFLVLPQLTLLLSREELAKAHRYRYVTDRDRHVVLWAGLRLIIGSLVSASPRTLRFERSQTGKPALSHPPVSLSFNATRAGPFVVFAISWSGPVGVDVEEVRPEIETGEIVKRFFHPQERHEYETLLDDLKPAAFFRSWTLKESYLKVRGVGLPFGLDRVHVTIDPREHPRLIAVEGMQDEQDRWNLTDLPMPDGYFGALASQGQGRRIQLLQLDLARLTSTAKPLEDCWPQSEPPRSASSRTGPKSSAIGRSRNR
jgi:4'-phosphopantetheinyl transferase